MLFAGTMVCITSVNASATVPLLWTNGVSTVSQNTPLSGDSNNGCTGYMQDVMVTELKASNRACLYGDDRLKIGYFSNGGPSVGVVGFAYSNEVHVLEGVCNGVKCRYSVDQDMIVTQQQISQYGMGVVAYRHVSERINQVRSSTGEVRYVFDSSHPDYAVTDDSGRYIWTPTYALSENGDWLAVELRDRGLAVIDTRTFEARQVVMSGNAYGYGFNPSEQLAVSNDGKSVAITGSNAGFTIVDVVSGCGQNLIGDLSRLPGTTMCPSTDLGIGMLFPNFSFAERPRFFGDGHQLAVTVHSWVDGSRNVTFLAHRAPSVHIVKLLSLGDSFTSGEGETDRQYYQPGTDDAFDVCHVSKRSYPLLVAAAIGVPASDAKSVACAGARMGDIVGSSSTYWGQGNRLGSGGAKLSPSEKIVAQEEALDNFQPGRLLQSTFFERYNPEMMTIGIGGNDAGLMGKLQVCAMPGTCEWAHGEGLRATAGEIKRLYDTLIGFYAYVADHAPATKIYVVGYPGMIEANGTCDSVTGFLLDRTERIYIEQSIAYLNQIICAAAQKAGFTYLDIEHSMDGRSLCGGSAADAMNGLRLGSDIAMTSALPMLKLIGSETFHPTPVGHSLMAEAILMGHPGLRTDATCATDPMSCNTPALSTTASPYWGVELEDKSRLSYVSEFSTQTGQDLRQVNISLPEGALEPSSVVAVEIHSDMTSLGSFTVDAKGGLNQAVSIPAELEDGFHTIHLFGVNHDGRDVDIYQVVTVGSPTDEVTGVQGGASGVMSISGSTNPILGGGGPLLITRIAEVLGAQVDAPQGEARRSDLFVPAHAVISVVRHLGSMGLIVIGAVTVSLLLLVIFLQRRWAKSGS